MKRNKTKQHYTINEYILEYSLYQYNLEYGYFNTKTNKWIVLPDKDISKLIEQEINQIKQL